MPAQMTDNGDPGGGQVMLGECDGQVAQMWAYGPLPGAGAGLGRIMTSPFGVLCLAAGPEGEAIQAEDGQGAWLRRCVTTIKPEVPTRPILSSTLTS